VLKKGYQRICISGILNLQEFFYHSLDGLSVTTERKHFKNKLLSFQISELSLAI